MGGFQDRLLPNFGDGRENSADGEGPHLQAQEPEDLEVFFFTHTGLARRQGGQSFCLSLQNGRAYQGQLLQVFGARCDPSVANVDGACVGKPNSAWIDAGTAAKMAACPSFSPKGWAPCSNTAPPRIDERLGPRPGPSRRAII